MTTLAVDAFLLATGVLHRANTEMSTTTHPFYVRVYLFDVAAQIIAIALTVAFLRYRGRQHLAPPLVSVIVGIHFIGLWWASGLQVFNVLAGLLTAVGMAALCFGRRVARLYHLHDGFLLLSGMGSAVAIWSIVAVSLLRR